MNGTKACSSPKGQSALGAMVANLVEGNPDLPPIAVHIYKIPIMNAFAVSGGSIIITEELIGTAGRPDESASVLAHEIGHVAHLHPEAQLVLLMGVEVLENIFTG